MTIGLSLMDLQYVGINTKHFLSMLDVDGTNFFISNFDFIGENALILIKDNIDTHSSTLSGAAYYIVGV